MQELGLTPENADDPVQVFNSCMDTLADAIRKPRIDPLLSQVACWENCSNADRSTVTHKVEEACQLMCDVIAPNDGKQSFQAIIDQQQNKGETGGAGIQALVIGLLQQTITWYKIRHTGGQAHYYSRTGTLKQRPVTLD